MRGGGLVERRGGRPRGGREVQVSRMKSGRRMGLKGCIIILLVKYMQVS